MKEVSQFIVLLQYSCNKVLQEYTMLIARKRSTVLLKKANADFLELFMSVCD